MLKVEDLLLIAQQLREDLDRRINSGEPNATDKIPCVGDIMCRIAPILKLYEKYVANFSKASSRLQSIKDQRPIFSDFLEQVRRDASIWSDDGVVSVCVSAGVCGWGNVFPDIA
jgi:hypothetical protein